MHENSWNAWLATFEVGERRYVETTPETYAHDCRMMNVPVSRRPAATRDWVFSTNTFTAVSASGKIGESVRYIICVERKS